MSARRRLLRVTQLALLAAAGIIGMLLADGVWDAVCFVLAALPLLIGGWRAWTLRAQSAKALRKP